MVVERPPYERHHVGFVRTVASISVKPKPATGRVRLLRSEAAAAGGDPKTEEHLLSLAAGDSEELHHRPGLASRSEFHNRPGRPGNSTTDPA